MPDNISFEKAPLVEIIAELRWLPLGLAAAQQGQMLLTLGGSDPDSFHFAFGRRQEVAAFANTEKLVPPGFPTPWHHIVWRFRNPEIEGALLQIGPGIFTANALQPYRRWSEFRGTVEQVLVGSSILDHELCFPIDGEYNGMAAAPHLVKEA